jgi:hypothetical protein
MLNCQNRGEARDLVMKKMVGKYKIYKASSREPQQGYIGIMEVKHDEMADSVTIRELFQKSETEIWDMPGTIYPKRTIYL